jgi:anti-anti-sigma factor
MDDRGTRTTKPSSSARRTVVNAPDRRLVVSTELGIVHVTGEVDAGTIRPFRAALELCEIDRLVRALDLSGVEFFSAAGVRCLVELRWSERPHPMIVASPAVRRVLALCRLEFLLAPHGWADAFDGWCTGPSDVS